MHPFSQIFFYLCRPIEKGTSLQKIVFNTGWLTFEKCFRFGLGLIVSVLVARHLGPERLGMLSYAFSIVSFMGTFIYLGLSGIVVRDIIRFPSEKEMLLGTTFLLKLAGSVFSFAAVVCLAMVSKNAGDKEFWILVIIALSLFAMPFETIEFWFQSQVTSKFSVIAKSMAFVSASSLKLLMVFMGASVVAIATASSLEAICAAVFLVSIYRYRGFSIFDWKPRMAKMKELLNQSWIIILSGFLALINLKIDQIMLRWICGAKEVGFYSVAVTFSEAWYFIPSVIVMSIYPSLIELKKTQSLVYEKRLQQVFDILFALAAVVALITTIIADRLISLLYSDAFAETSSILIIHVWAGIFMFMRALVSKWVLIEDALVFSLVSHGFGAIVNVVLNALLIPSFDGQGAAVATLCSYAASSYFFLFFYSTTRPLAIKMSRSFLLPVRLIRYGRKAWA